MAIIHFQRPEADKLTADFAASFHFQLGTIPAGFSEFYTLQFLFESLL